MRFDTFVSTHVPKFRQILNIILTLIDLVKQIHKRNVVHRNITPKKILIDPSILINNDQIQLKLIDFDFAHIDQKNNTNRKNQNMFSYLENSVENDFYLNSQFEVKQLNDRDIDDDYQQNDSERQSKTIDTSSICAILFWMITLHEPKESRNIDGKAPHELSEHIQLIEDELKKVTGRLLSIIIHVTNRFLSRWMSKEIAFIK